VLKLSMKSALKSLIFGGFECLPALKALVYDPSGKPSEDGYMAENLGQDQTASLPAYGEGLS
jgi:hypothetical protein